LGILRTQQLLRVAARNFWRFRLQASLILLASISGTGGVILSTGYAAGGRQKILDQFSRLGTNVIVVTPQQSRSVGGRARTGSLVTTLNAADYRAIEQSVATIAVSSPTVATVLRMRAGDLTKSTTVVGCEPGYFDIKHWEPVRGELFDEKAVRQQARVALLGASVARDLYGESDPTGDRVTINRVPFTVAGVLAERGQGLDAANEDDQIYVPLETVMHRLMNIEYFNSIDFEIESSSRMDSATEQIGDLLRQRHRHAGSTEDDFLVQNRKSLIETQLASFARLTFLVRWIAVSALVVSSLGVFAVTWIGIRNRTREIGTRRAIGALRADILIQFFAEGMIGTLIGCGSGLVIGYFVLQIIDRRMNQPFLFSMHASTMEVLLSISLYALFILISGLRAVRVEPMVALHTE
jgi:putative ABC transport system permease protein